MAIHPDFNTFPPELSSAPLTGYASSQPRGAENTWHSHDAAQLFHVVKGSVAVDTDRGTYFVPPERAVWLPPNLGHQGRYLADTEIRYLYVEPKIALELPKEPQVLQVTNLLRELILAFMSYPRTEIGDGPASRIGAVILDLLKILPASPLQLPMPRDDRLRQVCEEIKQCPADIPSLSDAAEACAMSVRSFERYISRETGMSFRAWCRQAKLFRALELLAVGQSVSDVSHKLGYEGPSAFVATFKKAFGVTPGRYFSATPAD